MVDFQGLLGEDGLRETGEKAMGDHHGTILIVDHDRRARAEAARVAVRLGYEVDVSENAELLLERLDAERPALAIVAVELSGPTSGLELLRELHQRFGDDLPVILVSGSRTTPLDRVAGLLLGADDYVLKPFDEGELLARARRSLRRARSGSVSGEGSANGKNEPEVSLSPREREILSLLMEGKTQKEIATALVISPKTVATHIQHLLGKLGVNSRTQAVAAAYRRGLVDGDVLAHGFSVNLGEPEPAFSL
jgi:two-component system, LuxR family, response regulator FixJ